jgi:hypothetical protein
MTERRAGSAPRAMIVKAVVVWVAGLLTLVPFGTYYLFFEAPREQYALLVTGVLFWIFGYWGVVGPLVAAIRVRRVFRAIELAGTRDELERALRSEETAEVAIEFIATENGIPRFLARRVYALLVRRFRELARAEASDGCRR